MKFIKLLSVGMFLFVTFCSTHSYAAGINCVNGNITIIRPTDPPARIDLQMPPVVYAGVNFADPHFWSPVPMFNNDLGNAGFDTIKCNDDIQFFIRNGPGYKIEHSINTGHDELVPNNTTNQGVGWTVNVQTENGTIGWSNTSTGLETSYSPSFMSSGIAMITSYLDKLDTGVARKVNGTMKAGLMAELWMRLKTSQTEFHLADIYLANDVLISIGSCDIDPSQLVRVHDLGSYNIQEFDKIGYTSAPSRIVLRADCNDRLHMYGTFTGITTSEKTVFGIDSGPGKASGLGIQIAPRGTNNRPDTRGAPFENGTRVKMYDIYPGDNGVQNLVFDANLYQLSNTVTPGNITATVNYTILYD